MKILIQKKMIAKDERPISDNFVGMKHDSASREEPRKWHVINNNNVLYFFHPDHIGSSTYLTDEAGNPYQFILYLPIGDMTDWWRYCANRVIKITR
ncbi:MAG: hypothetical protein IPI90_02865 [Saprospiraceae bacterium]|nr:hypothetical protein [Candidatus Vicinibacter affinis]